MRVLAISALLIVGACAALPATTATTSRQTPSAKGSPVLVAPARAQMGDRTACLVSGEEFTVTETSPKVEYGGQTYYFCCAGCDREFAANPEKFLKKQP